MATEASTAGGPSNNMASASQPPTIEVLDLSSGSAKLVARGNRSLMCDNGGRCAAIPVAKWESKGLGGQSWIYTATLVTADKIEGTVTMKDGAAEKEVGTFSLARQN
jgi:hypothetical protein